MNENTTKRREWVKTAAIIFLAVMLVLTFFSNTIMNYSLPIVAAQYINSGSITAKVRGTGTIEAGDPYNVELSETRVIKSVAVKQGDYVEKDQILFYLEDAESAELAAAEAELEKLMSDFKQALLTGGISNTVIENAQNGVEASTDTYQSRINAAQTKLDNAKAVVDDLTKQKSLVSLGGSVDTTAEETALLNAQEKLTDAKNTLTVAEGNLNSINEQITASDEETAKTNADNLLTVANAYLLPMQDAETVMNADSAKVNALLALKDAQAVYEQSVANAEAAEVIETNKTALLDAITAAVTAGCNLSVTDETITSGEIQTVLAAAQSAYETSAAAYTTAKENYDKAYAEYQAAYDQYLLFGQKKKAQTAVNNAKTAVTNAQNEVTNAQNALNNKKVSGDNSATLAELDKKLIEANSALSVAQEELDQLLKDISAELSLGDMNSSIKEKQELVAKLRAESVGAEVKAPVAGTITTLNYVAGETIDASMPLAVIQPDGKGFSLSFSVTADQAKRLSPGDVAEVQNSWYYSDITATLVQIKNDPQNPGKNKILVFDIVGDVMDGQSLSLSVGQKSANCDMIVPNSAIREDNNGKFVLIVESKSSPLGNRYIASRVDVEVLASDDTQSAISGALYGYEFVITTSNKPVEAGKQVRLSDS